MTKINYQAAYNYLLDNNLAFCFQPDGSTITLQECIKNLKPTVTMQEILNDPILND